MKKITLAFAAIAAISILASCEKERTPETKAQGIQFDFSIGHSGFNGGTKAVKTGWENGDKVYVFFDKDFSSADDMMTMTYDGSSWSYDAPAALTARLLASGSLDAIYCTETPTISYGTTVSFQGSKTGTCGYFTAANVEYTYADSKVKATITLAVPTTYIRAQIRISGLTGSGWYIKADQFNSYLSFTGNGYSWNGANSSGWNGNCYLGDEMQTYVSITDYAMNGARNWAITLSNGTDTYTKTFYSKSLPLLSAVTFAGPDNLDSPTNGWTKQ